MNEFEEFEERVIYKQRFQGTLLDYRARTCFQRYDCCEFVKAMILIDEDRAAALYAERFADADGRIRATFEIVSLAGWAPHESQQKPARRGSGKVSLATALNDRTGHIS